MKLSIKHDIFLNIILPISIGCTIYLSTQAWQTRSFITNQLPDGLWAYALLSGILIVWNRQINVYWVIIVFSVFVVFELLQYSHVINGTGDSRDIFTYFIFAAMALLLNNFFSGLLKNKRNGHP
jgi:hypothetical protein